MRDAVLTKIEATQLKKNVPHFKVGDSISVHIRIVEGNKERIQVFTGTVIAIKGSGVRQTVTLHRVAYGVGMKRVFLLHSPRIAKIELKKRGKVRRSKLYHLLGAKGKAARVKGQVAVTDVEAQVSPAVEEELVIMEEEIITTESEIVSPEESSAEERTSQE